MSLLDVKMKIGSEHYDARTGRDVWYTGRPNSVGGFDVKISFKNCGSKTIKYAVFVVVPYNRVGDIVASETSGSPEARLQYTGPLKAGRSVIQAKWETVWYNYSIKRAAIQSVQIQYTDGTEVTLSGNELGKKKGCYVATAVYGSYDCPQVWTLRRYRDSVLAATWYGRAFIHTYYAISPLLVNMFGKTKWFKKLWMNKLNRFVSILNLNGISDKPYKDLLW